jgi:alpha-tubulin suppressor-like RCC1 family protein
MKRLFAFVLSCAMAFVVYLFAAQSHTDVPAVAAQSRLSRSTQISLGSDHSCALLTTGVVKCWGANTYGQLGLGNTNSYGDNVGETGTGLPAVDLNQTAKYISAGYTHTCAIRADNSTVCWGQNALELGNGTTSNVGDASGEMGSNLVAVNLGANYATALSAGLEFTCAIVETGDVKCWGDNTYGQGGYDRVYRGSAVDLGVGRTAKAISTGKQHACAILDNDRVKCWGANTYGQLGLGTTDSLVYPNIGAISATVFMGLPDSAKAIAAGAYHTCVIVTDGSLKCWGYNVTGQLGIDSVDTKGDSCCEMGYALATVNLGTDRTAIAVAASKRGDLDYTCAVLDNGQVKCWGAGDLGQLAQRTCCSHIGDSLGEMALLNPINLGTGVTVTTVAVGAAHNCVILTTTNIKCFGHGQNGKLGYGNSDGYNADTADALPIVDLDGITATKTPTKTRTPSKTKTLTRSKTSTKTKTLTRSKTPTKTKTPTRTKSPTITPTFSATPTIP